MPSANKIGQAKLKRESWKNMKGSFALCGIFEMTSELLQLKNLDLSLLLIQETKTKLLCLLICKICGEVRYVWKAKTKFRYRFNNYKSKQRAFRKGNWKVSHKLFHTHYCFDGHSGIQDWDLVIFESCEAHAQLKERGTFWQHRLKTFYPIGLNEKEEYLY